VLPLIAIGYARGWSGFPMLVALVPAIVFWQLQEFIRRVLYTEGRYTGAFFNDVISYGGQAAVLAVLFAAKHYRGWRFDGAVALYVLAATSAAAVMLGLWQLRHSIARQLDRKAFAENWHFGKWLLGGELMQWCSSIHMQVWWAALLLGAWASADLRAAQILFGPTRVIAFFLCTVLPIRFARALHEHGPAAMHAQLRRVMVWLVPMAGSYCLLLVLFPRPLLHLVYGPGYAAGEAAKVLMLYSLNAFLGYMQMVIAAGLTASRRTRSMFAGNAIGCVVALALSPVFIKLFGASGAIVSMIATTLVTTLMFVIAYRNRTRQAAGFEVVPAAAATVACGPAGTMEDPV
jgi:O-antigen/teichoic acid export membrane protein